MKIKISEEKGELNFGVFWISLDGRFNTRWFQKYEKALEQYQHLKKLKREPTLNIRLEHPKDAQSIQRNKKQ